MRRRRLRPVERDVFGESSEISRQPGVGGIDPVVIATFLHPARVPQNPSVAETCLQERIDGKLLRQHRWRPGHVPASWIDSGGRAEWYVQTWICTEIRR